MTNRFALGVSVSRWYVAVFVGPFVVSLGPRGWVEIGDLDEWDLNTIEMMRRIRPAFEEDKAA